MRYRGEDSKSTSSPPPYHKFYYLLPILRLLKSDLVAGIFLFSYQVPSLQFISDEPVRSRKISCVLVIAISIIWKAPVPLLVGEQFLGNG
jgi:hypothetical protein